MPVRGRPHDVAPRPVSHSAAHHNVPGCCQQRFGHPMSRDCGLAEAALQRRVRLGTHLSDRRGRRSDQILMVFHLDSSGVLSKRLGVGGLRLLAEHQVITGLQVTAVPGDMVLGDEMP